MVTIQQGLREDGLEVSMVKLCGWFGVARRSVYYRPTKAPLKVRPELAAPIKAMIEDEPSFGYRTVTGLLGWHLSRSGKASTAAVALEQALITRFGTLAGCVNPSCCARTMAWCSPVAPTPAWCAATV